jgi:hypothetical protein
MALWRGVEVCPGPYQVLTITNSPWVLPLVWVLAARQCLADSLRSACWGLGAQHHRPGGDPQASSGRNKYVSEVCNPMGFLPSAPLQGMSWQLHVETVTSYVSFWL